MTHGNSDLKNGESLKSTKSDPDLEESGVTKKEPGAFLTISEVADEIHVPQHVLRFWETRFPQLQPMKRSGGRRYYRVEDVTLLKYISELLYVQGYTIKGVQRLLKEDFSKFSVMDNGNQSDDGVDQGTEQYVSPDSQAVVENNVPIENQDEAFQRLDELEKENFFLVHALEDVLSELEILRKMIAGN